MPQQGSPAEPEGEGKSPQTWPQTHTLGGGRCQSQTSPARARPGERPLLCPRQLLTLFPPLPLRPTALSNSMCQCFGLQLSKDSRISLYSALLESGLGLSSSRKCLNSREDLAGSQVKLMISRNFLDVLASACCQNFCYLSSISCYIGSSKGHWKEAEIP